MKLKDVDSKRQNFIISVVLLLIPMIALACRFDYYYDLNDDVLMKEILSGNYTGVPEGHNIQMLWLISAAISLLYRIVRIAPWYGIFLCACQFGALLLLLNRSFTICKSRKAKLTVGLVETLLFFALMMEHLVAVQYTVTCTMLAAAAAFWFLTSKPQKEPVKFIRSNIPAILLVFLAYLIRSEMLLLVLPMICVAGVVKWSFEEKAFTKENFIKYLGVIGLILLSLLIGEATHRIAYGSKEWRCFTTLFDNRTELYDFQQIPSYQANKEFYDSIGISESEQILFDNYNFGIDEEINETIMGQIADYAGGLNQEAQPFVPKLQKYFKLYVYRFLGGPISVGSDYPWNYMTILLYITVFLLALCQGWNTEDKRHYGIWKHRMVTGLSILWKLCFLFAVRSALWMYILMGERFPDRITHSLYFMEFAVLAGILFVLIMQKHGHGRTQLVRMTMLICFGLFSVLLLPGKIGEVAQDQKYREQQNAPYLQVYDYFAHHPENFYFMDVYSSVSYSEKMFVNVDNSIHNYDIMGGWASKSPLYRKKLKAYQINTMEEGLLSMENVYFVRKKAEDMHWLSNYYESHGENIKVTLVETIDNAFEIYRIEPANL